MHIKARLTHRPHLRNQYLTFVLHHPVLAYICFSPPLPLSRVCVCVHVCVCCVGDAEFTGSASAVYQFVEMAFASPSATPTGSRLLYYTLTSYLAVQ